ncbi:MAG: hypothetical protein OXU81_18950 [Gammaproteobacteria bacterium]|nr:hypothetical protein [Gammaproteobacteria bacterium]
MSTTVAIAPDSRPAGLQREFGRDSAILPIDRLIVAYTSLEEHERMGFHEGWGKAIDQPEALAASL